MMIKQRADIEGAKPIRDGKRMGIYEVIKKFF